MNCATSPTRPPSSRASTSSSPSTPRWRISRAPWASRYGCCCRASPTSAGCSIGRPARGTRARGCSAKGNWTTGTPSSLPWPPSSRHAPHRRWGSRDRHNCHAAQCLLACPTVPPSGTSRHCVARNPCPLDTNPLQRPNSPAKEEAPPMTIIDSQVHVYEANTPKRPWRSVPNWPPHVTGDEMVEAMDKVGVDGAIFISAFSMYGYDASYAVEGQRAHPGKFGIVKPVDPDDPAVPDVVADWKKTPGTVGIRIMMTKEANRDPADPGLDCIARAAVQHDFPVNMLCWGNLGAGTAIVDRHPDTRF